MSRLFPLIAASLLADTDNHSEGGGFTDGPMEDGEFEDGIEDDEFRAGDLKLLDDDNGKSADQLIDTVNRHTQIVQRFEGDIAKVQDFARRAVPDTQKLLAEAKRNAKAEWIPAGSVREFEALYLDSDDTPKMGRHTVSIPLPGGQTYQQKRHGVLTDPHPVIEEQKRAQRAYDGLVVAIMRARARKLAGAQRYSDPLVQVAWVQLRGALRSLPGTIGKYFRVKLDDADWLRSVIDGSAGSGGEVIPDPELAGLRRPTDLARRIPGLVGVRPAPSRSFHPIRVTGRILGQTRRVTEADPSRFPSTKFTTAKSTITVVDQVYMALLDNLFAGDAAGMLADPLGFVMSWIDEGRMDTMELAFLHSDGDGDIADVQGTWTMGGYYSAGDLDGATSALGWWQGWRARAAADSNTLSAGGSFDMADHFGALELLGNLANDAVAITGLHCLYTQLLGNSIFTTWEKMGPAATQITGTMGMIGNTRLVISEFMADEFDSSSGVYTGSNASSAITYVNASRYDYYDLAAGAGEFEAERVEYGAQYVGAVDRGILDYNGIPTEKPAAILYNL